MFFHIFKNRLKIVLNNKISIFWTSIFPIILVTLFSFAFSNISDGEQLKTIDLGIIKNDKYNSNDSLKLLIESLSADDVSVLNIIYIDEKNAADTLLNKGEIIGYLDIDEEINIIVKNNGINESIVKYIVDTYYQYNSAAEHIVAYDIKAIEKGVLNLINEEKEYFNSINSHEKLDYTVIMFYTLIGMVCMYGGMFGVSAVNESEANLTKKGARIAISPTHKMKVLLISLLISFLIQYVEIIVLLMYMLVILKIKLINIPLILLLTFIGTITGTCFGLLVGASSRKSENTKIGIIISISMLCSFLAGMMSPDIKYIVDTNLPILSKLNPVTIITDALYSLYYYDTLNRFYINILNLVILSLIMIIISYIFIRRKKYDSI